MIYKKNDDVIALCFGYVIDKIMLHQLVGLFILGIIQRLLASIV